MNIAIHVAVALYVLLSFAANVVDECISVGVAVVGVVLLTTDFCPAVVGWEEGVGVLGSVVDLGEA